MGLFGDFFRYEKRKFDEDRVIDDEIKRDRDLARGDFLGAAFEEGKIRYDKRELRDDFIEDDIYIRDRGDRRFRDDSILEMEMLEEEIIEDEIIEDTLFDDFRF